MTPQPTSAAYVDRLRGDMGPTPYRAWMVLLGVLMAAGAVAGLIVFSRGLVVTNLNDIVPWGLWITIDLSAIAMSAGAFLLCAAVYLLGLRQFQPLARTATYLGLIGYSMAVLTPAARHRPAGSLLACPGVLEPALGAVGSHDVCDALLQRAAAGGGADLRAHALGCSGAGRESPSRSESLHKLAPYLAVVGLGLSLLHQSSLGATYGVLKARPIWYRPDLSVLFIVSAMAAGPALTVLASMLAARLRKGVRVDDHLLERMAGFIGWVLVGYLYFRFWDAFAMTYTYEPGRTEGLRFLTGGPLSFNFWVLEVLLGAMVPASSCS